MLACLVPDPTPMPACLVPTPRPCQSDPMPMLAYLIRLCRPASCLTPRLCWPAPCLLLQLWSLKEQIQHKVDFLTQHVLLEGRPPVLLAGHSIGAYMMLHAAHQLESQSKAEPHQPAGPAAYGNNKMPQIIKVNP